MITESEIRKFRVEKDGIFSRQDGPVKRPVRLWREASGPGNRNGEHRQTFVPLFVHRLNRKEIVVARIG